MKDGIGCEVLEGDQAPLPERMLTAHEHAHGHAADRQAGAARIVEAADGERGIELPALECTHRLGPERDVELHVGAHHAREQAGEGCADEVVLGEGRGDERKPVAAVLCGRVVLHELLGNGGDAIEALHRRARMVDQHRAERSGGDASAPALEQLAAEFLLELHERLRDRLDGHVLDARRVGEAPQGRREVEIA